MGWAWHPQGLPVPQTGFHYMSTCEIKPGTRKGYLSPRQDSTTCRLSNQGGQTPNGLSRFK